eukprot:CAMPEP_0168771536 /NCGR_PEP_ID=MMETSP0725-20121227/3490_1 /TAXON_ID=265536 /ORGANISM="Amphiprora sp., Strain CCMP467" /LENGTH=96 /DNA_ID=CAMNT_0008821023 /DNA_START=129 /DNA_END=419 /DNA_ORIENTATION=-
MSNPDKKDQPKIDEQEQQEEEVEKPREQEEEGAEKTEETKEAQNKDDNLKKDHRQASLLDFAPVEFQPEATGVHHDATWKNDWDTFLSAAATQPSA